MNIKFNDALNKMGIHEKRFHLLLQSPSFELALERLEDLKKEVRRKRRLLAKQFHPDIVGEEGLEKMKEINLVAEALLRIQVRITPPQRVVETYVYTHFANAWSTDNVNTFSTSNASYASIFRRY